MQNDAQEPLQILVRYHDDSPGEPLQKIEKITIGDWIDLRAAEDVHLFGGSNTLISLGVSMKLPEGYEAHIVPRSSTYLKYKIMQTNSMVIIDNSYSGDGDIWKMPVLAFDETTIHKNDRICQFRIVKRMPDVEFVEVEVLDDNDRGGFGSTGT